MEAIVIREPDTQAVTAEISSLSLASRALLIETVEQHAEAQRVLLNVTRCERGIRDLFKEAKENAHKLDKSVREAEEKLLAPILTIRREIGGKCAAFVTKQRLEAQEEERARQAALKQKTDDDALRTAEVLEKKGAVAEASRVIEEAVSTPVPRINVTPTVARVQGVSSREVWRAELVDLPQLIVHVAHVLESEADDGTKAMWASLLLPNMGTLNAMARERKASFTMPGVVAVSERTMSVRA